MDSYVSNEIQGPYNGFKLITVECIFPMVIPSEFRMGQQCCRNIEPTTIEKIHPLLLHWSSVRILHDAETNSFSSDNSTFQFWTRHWYEKLTSIFHRKAFWNKYQAKGYFRGRIISGKLVIWSENNPNHDRAEFYFVGTPARYSLLVQISWDMHDDTFEVIQLDFLHNNSEILRLHNNSEISRLKMSHKHFN